MSVDTILSLSTEVVPPKKFEVDGVEYDLLGLEHLSEDEEARATAAFMRFGRLLGRLENSTNDRESQKIARALRTRRIELITQLTTLPLEVAEKLPLSGQTRLFRAIQEETGQEALSDLDDEDIGTS